MSYDNGVDVGGLLSVIVGLEGEKQQRKMRDLRIFYEFFFLDLYNNREVKINPVFFLFGLRVWYKTVILQNAKT